MEALPECLSRAAEIAEGKGNFSRARTLRVRLGTVLDSLGRQEEALEAVRYVCSVAQIHVCTVIWKALVCVCIVCMY